MTQKVREMKNNSDSEILDNQVKQFAEFFNGEIVNLE